MSGAEDKTNRSDYVENQSVSIGAATTVNFFMGRSYLFCLNI